MSYRELRNFTEVMKSLGYTRVISMGNFRTPNFELVADILYWLLIRYDPKSTISDEISTEKERVKFIREACQLFSTKARMKINPKKVYSSDGFAVKELLKIANMMYAAQKNVGADKAGPGQASVHVEPDFTLASRRNDMKMSRELTSEITQSAMRLNDLLKRENEYKKARAQAINVLYSGDLGTDKVEREISSMSESLQMESERLDQTCKELDRDAHALTEKIQKKELDLERCKKRLVDLEQVRPAFMDEFEKLEGDLEKYYKVYIDKFRNVEFLEHQLEQYNQHEQEKLEESERALRRMQKRLREEELKILRGEQETGDGGFDGGGDFGGGFDGGMGFGRGMDKSRSNEVYGSLDGGSDTDDSDLSVLDSDNSGGMSSDAGTNSDDLIDDDDDQDDDGLSDMLSGDSASGTSLSDNDF